MPSKVYFTRNITPESVLKLYAACGLELSGNVAVKLHSGEKGNQNFLPPEFWRSMIERVHGTVVECNTAYPGSRNTTAAHWQTMRDHGWSDAFTVDIMDEEGPDLQLLIPNGKVIQKNYVGKHLTRYDSMLVLSHFKGHPMGGFGGALKNVSIGIASSNGKRWIHSAGVAKDKWVEAEQDDFLESMAEADEAVISHMNGKMMYLNVMNRLSVDCDCFATPSEPDMHDIGVLSSFDPVALDQACVDLIHVAPDGASVTERIATRHGEHTLEYAEELGLGSRAYRLTVLE